jgi:hypothetical protein
MQMMHGIEYHEYSSMAMNWSETYCFYTYVVAKQQEKLISHLNQLNHSQRWIASTENGLYTITL